MKTMEMVGNGGGLIVEGFKVGVHGEINGQQRDDHR